MLWAGDRLDQQVIAACIACCMSASGVKVSHPNDDIDPLRYHNHHRKNVDIIECMQEERIDHDVFGRSVVRVPQFAWNDGCTTYRLREGLPTVLIHSDLAKSARKWTAKYLSEHFPAQQYISVLQTSRESVNGHPLFVYRKENHENAIGFKLNLARETTIRNLTMQEFLTETKHGNIYAQGVPINPTKIGSQLQSDFYMFGWQQLNNIHKSVGWDEVRRNQIGTYAYIGGNNAVTPLHYDNGENILIQARGSKEIFLWSPADWKSMAPLPLTHPSNQGSRLVDIWSSDEIQRNAPNFTHAKPYWVVLNPGQALYIPSCWWHNVQVFNPIPYLNPRLTVNVQADNDPHGVSISFSREGLAQPKRNPSLSSYRIYAISLFEAVAVKYLGVNHVVFLRELSLFLSQRNGTLGDFPHLVEGDLEVRNEWHTLWNRILDSGYKLADETIEDFLVFSFGNRFDLHVNDEAGIPSSTKHNEL